MRDWPIKVGFVIFILIILVPSRFEIAFVTNFYRSHVWLSGLLIVVLAAGIGWWLRSAAEHKLEKPIKRNS